VRRKSRSRSALLVLLLAIGAMTFFTAGPAAADPPYPCDEENFYVTVDYQGIEWECLPTGYGGGFWDPKSRTRRYHLRTGAYDHGIWGYTWVASTILTTDGGNHIGGSQVFATMDSGRRELHGPGALRTRAEVTRWNGSRWVHCISNSWNTNTRTQANWSSSVYMGVSPDCGTGTYSTIGVSEKNTFGTWFGSFGQSGGIYMTDTSPAAAGSDAPAVDGG